jgi:hypothetical protein
MESIMRALTQPFLSSLVFTESDVGNHAGKIFIFRGDNKDVGFEFMRDALPSRRDDLHGPMRMSSSRY